MKPKAIITLILLGAALGTGSAQTRDFSRIRSMEDSLGIFAGQMVNAMDANTRYQACMAFIPHLVHALETPYSFDYPFDSLKQVSIVYPPDSSFRIFTWAITTNDGISYRFYGTLQMHTRDGKLKLFPFFDNTRYTSDLDTVTSNKAWIGALYYRVLENKRKGRNIYTLFGWHGVNFESNQKLLEALSFKDGEPVFGAPVFDFSRDSVPGKTLNRFLLIYSKNGEVGLNYDPDQKLIVYDHLVSLTGKPEEKYTLVPDGTYEGFKWQGGSWVHLSRIFNTVSQKPPVPQPMKFKKNILEKDLQPGTP
jgi:hypothetical protein